MSATEPDVLYASKSEIRRHWRSLLAGLGSTLPKAGGKYWIEESLTNGISGDLFCSRYNSEKALRERGAEIPVVPLLVNRNREIRYWVSFHQRWSEPTIRRREALLYHTTGITIFCGTEFDRDKVQLFRAEWPGLRRMADGSVEFEAPGAGHPHWQFDAYQHHLRERQQQQKRRDELEILLRGEQPEVEEFAGLVFEGPSPDKETEFIRDMQRLTRVHFASSTRWADNPWDGELSDVQAHAHAPADLSQILNWSTSTISYIQQEASR
jgi:hypothetical protein